jgi:hypothetical protein
MRSGRDLHRAQNAKIHTRGIIYEFKQAPRGASHIARATPPAAPRRRALHYGDEFEQPSASVGGRPDMRRACARQGALRATPRRAAHGA